MSPDYHSHSDVQVNPGRTKTSNGSYNPTTIPYPKPSKPEEYLYDELKGYIHHSKLILDTGSELPGIHNVGAALYSGKDVLPQLKELGIIDNLLSLINFRLQSYTDKVKKVKKKHLLSAIVCKYDLTIWQVEFKAKYGEDFVQEIIKVTPEYAPNPPFHTHEENQGLVNPPFHTHGENRGLVNPPTHTHGENRGLVNPPTHTHGEGLGFVAPLISTPTLLNTLNMEIPNKNIKGPAMRVAVVDRGDFSDQDENPNTLTHAQVIRRIIEHGSNVEAVALPIVDHYDDEADLFDLICALSNRAIVDQVQVINLSMGWYAPYRHPVLEKVLNKIKKPIVCSSGNLPINTDVWPHWPSNFSVRNPNVISVSAENLSYGERTVTVVAKGHWNQEVIGASFAAAWMSRMIATAFSLERNVHLEIDDVAETLEKEFSVKFVNSDKTVTKLRFLP